MGDRYLFVTIDTEVDKDASWRIASPASFDSVLEGIPNKLTPLFEEHGVRPTYLLSPEVIESAACAAVLGELQGTAELGTHLHAEFVNPDRLLDSSNMDGRRADAIQSQYPYEVEQAKLRELTELFTQTFGLRPRSFRAGRFAIRAESFAILAELGYQVDSSITPGLLWNYSEGVVDHVRWRPTPQWLSTPHGRLLELPVSVEPIPVMRAIPKRLRPRIATLARGRAYRWLRPSWATGSDLVRYVRRSRERFLVVMFHSTEIALGRSPYSRTATDVDGILGALDELFTFCREEKIGFPGLSEAAQLA